MEDEYFQYKAPLALQSKGHYVAFKKQKSTSTNLCLFVLVLFEGNLI